MRAKCRKCSNAAMRQHAKDNPETVKMWNENFYKKNPHKRREYDQKHYYNSRDSILEQKKDYYKDNVENIRDYRKNNKSRISERQREYKQENKALIAEISSRRRARQRSIYTEKIDLDRIVNNSNGICHICGHLITDNIQYDHVVPIVRHGDFCMGEQLVSEHSYGNIKPAHPTCNQKKGRKVMEEIYLNKFSEIVCIGGDANDH